MSLKFIISGAACIFETTFLISLADYPSVEPLMMSLVAIAAVLAELSFSIWLGFNSLSKSSSAVSPSINNRK